MGTRDIQVRRGIKAVALFAVGTVVVVILLKILASIIIPFAIAAFVLWLIYRALRT